MNSGDHEGGWRNQEHAKGSRGTCSWLCSCWFAERSQSTQLKNNSSAKKHSSQPNPALNSQELYDPLVVFQNRISIYVFYKQNCCSNEQLPSCSRVKLSIRLLLMFESFMLVSLKNMCVHVFIEQIDKQSWPSLSLITLLNRVTDCREMSSSTQRQILYQR